MPMSVLRSDERYHSLPARSAIGVCLARGDDAADMARYLLEKSVVRGTVPAQADAETVLGGVSVAAWEAYARENNFTKTAEVLDQFKQGKIGKKSEEEKMRFQKFQEAVAAATHGAASGVRGFSTATLGALPRAAGLAMAMPAAVLATPVRVHRAGLGTTMGALVRRALRYMK